MKDLIDERPLHLYILTWFIHVQQVQNDQPTVGVALHWCLRGSPFWSHCT